MIDHLDLAPQGLERLDPQLRVLLLVDQHDLLGRLLSPGAGAAAAAGHRPAAPLEQGPQQFAGVLGLGLFEFEDPHHRPGGRLGRVELAQEVFDVFDDRRRTDRDHRVGRVVEGDGHVARAALLLGLEQLLGPLGELLRVAALHRDDPGDPPRLGRLVEHVDPALEHEHVLMRGRQQQAVGVRIGRDLDRRAAHLLALRAAGLVDHLGQQAGDVHGAVEQHRPDLELDRRVEGLIELIDVLLGLGQVVARTGQQQRVAPRIGQHEEHVLGLRLGLLVGVLLAVEQLLEHARQLGRIGELELAQVRRDHAVALGLVELRRQIRDHPVRLGRADHHQRVRTVIRHEHRIVAGGDLIAAERLGPLVEQLLELLLQLCGLNVPQVDHEGLEVQVGARLVQLTHQTRRQQHRLLVPHDDHRVRPRVVRDHHRERQPAARQPRRHRRHHAAFTLLLGIGGPLEHVLAGIVEELLKHLGHALRIGVLERERLDVDVRPARQRVELSDDRPQGLVVLRAREDDQAVAGLLRNDADRLVEIQRRQLLALVRGHQQPADQPTAFALPLPAAGGFLGLDQILEHLGQVFGFGVLKLDEHRPGDREVVLFGQLEVDALDHLLDLGDVRRRADDQQAVAALDDLDRGLGLGRHLAHTVELLDHRLEDRRRLAGPDVLQRHGLELGTAHRLDVELLDQRRDHLHVRLGRRDDQRVAAGLGDDAEPIGPLLPAAAVLDQRLHRALDDRRDRGRLGVLEPEDLDHRLRRALLHQGQHLKDELDVPLVAGDHQPAAVDRRGEDVAPKLPGDHVQPAPRRRPGRRTLRHHRGRDRRPGRLSQHPPRQHRIAEEGDQRRAARPAEVAIRRTGGQPPDGGQPPPAVMGDSRPRLSLSPVEATGPHHLLPVEATGPHLPPVEGDWPPS